VDALTSPTWSAARRGRLVRTLRLRSVPGLGRARAARWIRSEGGLEPALARAAREVAPPALDRAAAEREAEALLRSCERDEVRIVLPGDATYPESFAHLADPPGLLFLRGEPLRAGEPAVAVVGSRDATSYGQGVARDLGRALGAAGVCVVSGLARGVDGAAHHGALEAGARTIAVLGRGPDRAYPACHGGLMRKIATSGALWSEYAPGVGPRRHHFPERNRLIAGLSRATVVVEAAARSGALITARLGLEAGADVWAVPGRIDSERSAGSHALIRDGARPVCSIAELVETYADGGTPPAATAPRDVSGIAAAVWERLPDHAVHLDDLMADWRDGRPGAGSVLAALAELELRGWVRRLPDASWARRAA